MNKETRHLLHEYADELRSMIAYLRSVHDRESSEEARNCLESAVCNCSVVIDKVTAATECDNEIPTVPIQRTRKKKTSLEESAEESSEESFFDEKTT